MQTLDEAIAALGHDRLMVMVVSDGSGGEDEWPENPVDSIPRERWPSYEVEEIRRSGSHSVLYRSPQVEADRPDEVNVRIRVEYLYVATTR